MRLAFDAASCILRRLPLRYISSLDDIFSLHSFHRSHPLAPFLVVDQRCCCSGVDHSAAVHSVAFFAPSCSLTVPGTVYIYIRNCWLITRINWKKLCCFNAEFLFFLRASRRVRVVVVRRTKS